jgi:iron complex outermembrane receptor protein
LNREPAEERPIKTAPSDLAMFKRMTEGGYMITGFRAKRLYGTLLASVGSALVLSSVAIAQTAPATEATAVSTTSATASTPPSDQLGAIVVTAQRRSENLQKVPITVSVVTGVNVSNYAIQTSQHLQTAVAGLIINKAQMNAAPFLRGVGANSGAAGLEMPVAIYLDGIYLPIAPGNVFNLSSIDRVEVLKGPQGTVFGRNATGGVISIVTRDPGEKARGDFDVSYGNYKSWTANAYVGGPIGDTIAADVVYAGARQGDGFGKNITTGGSAAREYYDDVIRSKVIWKLDEATDLTVTGQYSRQKSSVIAFTPAPGASDFLNAIPAPKGFYDAYGSESYAESHGYAVSGKLRHDFGWATVSDIVGYQDSRIRENLDFDAVVSATDDNTSYNREKVFTNELQIASPSNQTITWVAGLFYMDLGNLGRYGTAYDYPGSIFTLDLNTATTKSIAPFGQVTWNISKSTRLTGGVRYTRDHLRIHGDGVNAVVSGHQLVPTDTVNYTVDQKSSQGKLTFRASLEQDISRDVMAYASFNRGFRAGIFNTGSPLLPVTKPEVLDAYEVGLKTSFFDQKVTLDASIFHYEYSNILLRAYDPITQKTFLTNAAHAVETGADVDLRARFEGFDVTGGLEVISAHYNDFPDAVLSTRLPNGQNTETIGSATGNRLVQVPKMSLQFGVARSVSLGASLISVSVNIKHTSSTVFDPDNRFVQPSVNLLSGSLRWNIPGKPWEISLFGTNMLNQKYYQGYSNGGSDYIVVADPRQYGIRLGAHF